MEGSGKPLLHTSGSSVIGDDARSNRVSDAIFDEDTPFVVAPAKQARHDLNGTVLAAAARGVRSVVICPTLIYGVGKGLNPSSIQIPFLVAQARSQGAVRVVGSASTAGRPSMSTTWPTCTCWRWKGRRPAYFISRRTGRPPAEIGAAIAAHLAWVPSSRCRQSRRRRRGGPAGRTTPSEATAASARVRARRELGWAPGPAPPWTGSATRCPSDRPDLGARGASGRVPCS